MYRVTLIGSKLDQQAAATEDAVACAGLGLDLAVENGHPGTFVDPVRPNLPEGEVSSPVVRRVVSCGFDSRALRWAGPPGWGQDEAKFAAVTGGAFKFDVPAEALGGAMGDRQP